jgi:hypothetical protein
MTLTTMYVGRTSLQMNCDVRIVNCATFNIQNSHVISDSSFAPTHL